MKNDGLVIWIIMVVLGTIRLIVRRIFLLIPRIPVISFEVRSLCFRVRIYSFFNFRYMVSPEWFCSPVKTPYLSVT